MEGGQRQAPSPRGSAAALYQQSFATTLSECGRLYHLFMVRGMTYA
jgi:hypothetical protein